MSQDNGIRYRVESIGMEIDHKFMELPRLVVADENALETAGRVIRGLKIGRKGLGVCDSFTRDLAGTKIQDIVSSHGITVDLVEIKEADMETVERIGKIIVDGQYDFVLGIGGGRPIDVAKLSSSRNDIPFISVPTAASHDGIVSRRASILDGGIKKSFDAQTPIALIGDTKIISQAPHRLLAAGCGDIISNITAVMDWELAYRLKNEYFSSYAAALSKMSASMIIENATRIKPGHEPSAKLVVKALVSSGVAMSIAGSSRPASGSEHLFSHALDMIAPKPALHGEQCGVGTIMMAYLHGADWKEIRRALLTVGAPVDARGLGIDDDIIIEALMKAQTIRPERYTILSGGLSIEAARKLAERTMVITGGE